MTWGLSAHLVVGAGLVALALLAFMVRRDLRGVLLGVMLVLAAAVLDFVAAGRLLDDLAGAVGALLVLVLGAAQLVVLTAIARPAAPPDEPRGRS